MQLKLLIREHCFCVNRINRPFRRIQRVRFVIETLGRPNDKRVWRSIRAQMFTRSSDRLTSTCDNIITIIRTMITMIAILEIILRNRGDGVQSWNNSVVRVRKSVLQARIRQSSDKNYTLLCFLHNNGYKIIINVDYWYNYNMLCIYISKGEIQSGILLYLKSQ